MLYSAHFIIYLWLVPVFFLLFLPLVITATTIPLALTQRLFFTERTSNKEKRSHPRFRSSKDTIAKITVGNMTYTALYAYPQS